MKKKIYSSLLTVGLASTLSVVSVASLTTSFTYSTSDENSVSKVSSSLNADDNITSRANDATYLLPWNNNSASTDLDSPVQNIALDSTGSNFTLLTSSQSTYQNDGTSVTAEGEETYDYLTNYNMSSGNSVWTVNASSLSSLGGSATGKSFVAVSYIASYGSNSAYYGAVIETSNAETPYCFALFDASSGNLVSSQTISSVSSTGSGVEFYIQDNSFTSLDVNVYATVLSSDSTSSISVASYSLTDTTLSVSENTKTFDSSLIISYFATGTDANSSSTTVNSRLSKVFSDKSYMYFVFQDESVTYNTSSTNYVTLLRISKTSSNPTINSTSLYSISLTTDQVNQLTTSSSANNLSVATTMDGTTISLVISSSNTSTFLTTSLSSSVFSTSQLPTFTSITSSETNGFIVSISKLYVANSTTVDAYVALLSNNTAIRISSDFTTASTLYNFSNLSANGTDSKLIFNVFTISGDANWYAQMTDGSIIQFSGSNLVGQMGTDSIQNRTEFLAGVSLLSESNLPSSLLFQSVSDSSFSTYISSNASSFLDISSYDSVFGTPIFTATVNSNTQISGTSNYSVSITFYQSLRSINNGTIVTTSPSSVAIATQVYTFINADSTITVKDRSIIPASITSLLPSEVTTDQVEQILDIENAGNYIISLNPDDTNGILSVNVKSDAVWIDGSLRTDYTQTVTIGSTDSPYFTIDVFNGLDASITLVTEDYLDQATNATLRTTLINKYTNTLPSEVTAQNILDDFLILGNAFSNLQLIANGVVQSPTIDNVELYPVDALGYIYVTVTIPVVGSNTNVTYSFQTGEVFKQDFTSNQDVYLSFKNNDTVLATTYTSGSGDAQTTTTIGTLTPSSVQSIVNNDKTTLFYFMDMSYYVYNLITGADTNNPNAATYSITPNDALGTLTITITFNQTIDGLASSYSCVFTDFTKSGSNSGAPSALPTFSWGQIDTNALSGVKLSDITASYIETNFPQLFVYGNSASQLTHDVSITKMNASGAVLVTITFYDWWETETIDGVTSTVKVPEKTFSTVLKNGLSIVEDSVDSIVWKSFAELTSSDATITASTASNALTLINSLGTDLEKLEKVANISDVLLTKLTNAIAENSNALSLSITTDDSTGTLSFYGTIIIDDTTYTISNTLTGFDLLNSNYSVSLVADNSDEANALKSIVPSNLTYEQIASLVTITLGNDLEKQISSSYDDLSGTLTVTVNLYKDGVVVATAERTYTGFTTMDDINYQGTDILIVVASIIIPIVLLLAPILYIMLFHRKRQVKKLSKVLDKRLTQQAKQKRYVEVNKVEDLLKIESSRS